MDNLSVPIPSISPQPAVEPEVSTSSESSNRRWILWSAIGLTFLIFGIAIGIFSAKFLGRSQSQSQLTSTPTPSPSPQSPIPSPAPDPTTDWKTYTNIKYRYSFKYPRDWFGTNLLPGQGSAPLNDTATGIEFFPDGQEGAQIKYPRLAVEVDDPALNITLTDFDSWALTIKKNQFYQVSKESTQTLAGYTAIVAEGTYSRGGISTYHKTYLLGSPDQKFVTILLDDDAIRTNRMLFDQILSTFKFLD